LRNARIHHKHKRTQTRSVSALIDSEDLPDVGKGISLENNLLVNFRLPLKTTIQLPNKNGIFLLFFQELRFLCWVFFQVPFSYAMPSWAARSAFTGIEDDVSNAFEPWIGTEIGRGNRATGMKTTLQNEGISPWEN